MIKLYKKKPVVIEAIQYEFDNKTWKNNINEIKTFVGDLLKIEEEIHGNRSPGTLKIKTLEGDMTVSVNDYVIKGVQGEFYPCKPDIFNSTYEEVENKNYIFENKEGSGWQLSNITGIS